MQQNRQDDRTRLLVKDSEYEPSSLCKLCGMPTRNASTICLHCLDARFLTEELAYTREWLREHRDLRIELGHDKHKVVHLVLLRDNVRKMGWCGAKVTQARSRRTTTQQGVFPPGVCVQCFAAYEGMGL